MVRWFCGGLTGGQLLTVSVDRSFRLPVSVYALQVDEIAREWSHGFSRGWYINGWVVVLRERAFSCAQS